MKGHQIQKCINSQLLKIEYNKSPKSSVVRWKGGVADISKYETFKYHYADDHLPTHARRTIKISDWWQVFIDFDNGDDKNFKVKVKNNEFDVAFDEVINRIIKIIKQKK